MIMSFSLFRKQASRTALYIRWCRIPFQVEFRRSGRGTVRLMWQRHFATSSPPRFSPLHTMQQTILQKIATFAASRQLSLPMKNNIWVRKISFHKMTPNTLFIAEWTTFLWYFILMILRFLSVIIHMPHLLLHYANAASILVAREPCQLIKLISVILLSFKSPHLRDDLILFWRRSWWNY